MQTFLTKLVNHKKKSSQNKCDTDVQLVNNIATETRNAKIFGTTGMTDSIEIPMAKPGFLTTVSEKKLSPGYKSQQLTTRNGNMALPLQVSAIILFLFYTVVALDEYTTNSNFTSTNNYKQTGSVSYK